MHEVSLLILFFFLPEKSVCPVFNSYSKLWDYENVTRRSSSQNMSHVLKIQEAHRPLVQKLILILSYNCTNIQRKELEYVIDNDFILASWSEYLYGGTLKSAFCTDNMKLIYCIALYCDRKGMCKQTKCRVIMFEIIKTSEDQKKGASEFPCRH